MILCAGEALIDMLPRESAAGEACFAPYPGGAVFNTAIALGRLGVETRFFCPLSDDLFGTKLRAALDASGVDHSLCPAAPRPCTLAFVSLQNGQARYAFYDRETALRAMTRDDLPALPQSVKLLFMGGISLVDGPCADAFEALAMQAQERILMLDPNIRPGFITDEAAYRARLGRLLARADIVKLSDEDLHWLMGAGDVAELARALCKQGPQVVVITEGAEGARAFTGAGMAQASAERVEVVDTVGAGDTFNAGFLVGLLRTDLPDRAGLATLTPDALEQALSLGARAAAVTVSRAGANPPWAGEL